MLTGLFVFVQPQGRSPYFSVVSANLVICIFAKMQQQRITLLSTRLNALHQSIDIFISMFRLGRLLPSPSVPMTARYVRYGIRFASWSDLWRIPTLSNPSVEKRRATPILDQYSLHPALHCVSDKLYWTASCRVWCTARSAGYDSPLPPDLSSNRTRERANFTGLIIGCIEANFCKKICVGKLSPRSTQCTPLHSSAISIFTKICQKFC